MYKIITFFLLLSINYQFSLFLSCCDKKLMSKCISYSDDSVVQGYLRVLFKQVSAISQSKLQSLQDDEVCTSTVSKAIRLLRPSNIGSGPGRGSLNRLISTICVCCKVNAIINVHQHLIHMQLLLRLDYANWFWVNPMITAKKLAP